MPYGFVNTWNTVEDACSSCSFHLKRRNVQWLFILRKQHYFVRQKISILFSHIFCLTKACLLRVVTNQWHMGSDLVCRSYLCFCLAVKAAACIKRRAATKLRLSLHLHFAAISQVWKLWCKNRCSLEYSVTSFLFIFHKPTTLLNWSTWIVLGNKSIAFRVRFNLQC